jgi:PIN domain nuclease of toxin-antitoxin system
MDHLAAIVSMPFHHKDPFDRMLVAQSLVDSFPIVSADAVLDQYSVKRLW